MESLETGKAKAPERGEFVIGRIPAPIAPLGKLLGHRVAHEQRLGVLREIRLAARAGAGHSPALGPQDAGKQPEQGGLSAAVAAHERVHAAAGDAHIHTTEHPGSPAVVAHMRVATLGAARGPSRVPGRLTPTPVNRTLHLGARGGGAARPQVHALSRVRLHFLGHMRRHDHGHA